METIVEFLLGRLSPPWLKYCFKALASLQMWNEKQIPQKSWRTIKLTNKVVQNALISGLFFNNIGAFHLEWIYLEGGPLHGAIRVYSNVWWSGSGQDNAGLHTYWERCGLTKLEGPGFQSLIHLAYPGPTQLGTILWRQRILFCVIYKE